MSEQPPNHEQNRANYLAARDELARLYDAPDKTLPVHQHREQLRRARNTVSQTHQTMINAWKGTQ